VSQTSEERNGPGGSQVLLPSSKGSSHRFPERRQHRLGQAQQHQDGTGYHLGTYLRVLDDEVQLLHRYLSSQILALFS